MSNTTTTTATATTSTVPASTDLPAFVEWLGTNHEAAKRSTVLDNKYLYSRGDRDTISPSEGRSMLGKIAALANLRVGHAWQDPTNAQGVPFVILGEGIASRVNMSVAQIDETWASVPSNWIGWSPSISYKQQLQLPPVGAASTGTASTGTASTKRGFTITREQVDAFLQAAGEVAVSRDLMPYIEAAKIQAIRERLTTAQADLVVAQADLATARGAVNLDDASTLQAFQDAKKRVGDLETVIGSCLANLPTTAPIEPTTAPIEGSEGSAEVKEPTTEGSTEGSTVAEENKPVEVQAQTSRRNRTPAAV